MHAPKCTFILVSFSNKTDHSTATTKVIKNKEFSLKKQFLLVDYYVDPEYNMH